MNTNSVMAYHNLFEHLLNMCYISSYIVSLTGKLKDALHPLRACRRWCYMSTYEKLQLIVSIAVLIVAILNYTHKK